MALSYTTNWGTAILRAMLRSTNPIAGQYQIKHLYLGNTGVASIYKYITNMTSAYWNSASDGIATMTSLPRLTTNSSDGVITEALVSGSSGLINGISAATSSPGGIILDSLTVTSGSAVNVTNFSVGLPASRGTVFLNAALRNKIVDLMTQKVTTHFSANGTIKVYDGSAPATADDTATGTELISFAIDTTSSFSYNDVTSDACSLVSSISATASATGTAGYARFSWTSGSDTFVIQGTVGTSGTDFVINNTSITSGNSFNLTNATMSFA